MSPREGATVYLAFQAAQRDLNQRRSDLKLDPERLASAETLYQKLTTAADLLWRHFVVDRNPLAGT